MRYFKLQTGFNPEDFISITENELEKAIYAQITGAVAIFNNGTVRGNNILSLKEDIYKAMDWNYGYKILPEEWTEINNSLKRQGYVGLISQAKNNVQRLLNENGTDEIGKTNYEEIGISAPRYLQEDSKENTKIQSIGSLLDKYKPEFSGN